MGHPRHLRSVELVRLLAEPDRRQVMAALILEPGPVDSIRKRTGLSLRAVTTALARLVAGDLVEQGSDGTYVVLEEAFALAARSDVEPRPPSEHHGEPSHIARVLDQAFRHGRLVHLPTKRAKRLIVLDRLTQEFEPGRHYTERQINAALVSFDQDVAVLRRYLVDEGFLDRADGVYWRCGGTVPTEDSGQS